MPFAAYNKISQDPLEGGIEITELQYLEALEGLQSGLMVTIDDGFKVAPPPIVEPDPELPPTPEQLASAAIAQRDELLRVAAIRIAPLQDAVDLDDATPADIPLLKKWKQYRVAVNRVQDQAGFPQTIEWPVIPN